MKVRKKKMSLGKQKRGAKACRSSSTFKVLLWATVVLWHLLVSAVGDEGGPSPSSSSSSSPWDKQGPNLAERAIGFKSYSNTWDKIRSWLSVVWTSGRSLHMERADKFPSSAGVVKEAVSQSIHSSKSATENVVRVAQDVAQETAEKVKRTISNSRSSHEHSHEEL